MASFAYFPSLESRPPEAVVAASCMHTERPPLIRPSSSQATYRSARRKRQASFTPLLVLPPPNPLRWASAGTPRSQPPRVKEGFFSSGCPLDSQTPRGRLYWAKKVPGAAHKRSAGGLFSFVSRRSASASSTEDCRTGRPGPGPQRSGPWSGCRPQSRGRWAR